MADEKEDLSEGRICPVYALSPMRILGLSQESALLAVIIYGAGQAFFGAFFATPVAFAVAWVVEKVSAGREPGFAVQWVSAHAKGSMARTLSKAWGRVGLMPSPNHQSIYEP